MRRQNGQAMGFAVLCLPFLFLIVALTLDAGLFWGNQNHVDQANEAASLAGAVQISPSDYYTTGSVELPGPSASNDPVQAAVLAALQDQFSGDTITECPGSPAATFSSCTGPTTTNQVYYFVVQSSSQVTIYLWVTLTNPFGGILGSKLETLTSVRFASPEAAP